MSELEGQQQGLWESHVSFVRAPERGGEKERERESKRAQAKGNRNEVAFFFSLLKSVSASEMIRDRAFWPSRPGPFYLCSFLLRGPVSAAMSSSPGRKTVVEEEEGHELGGACKDSAS